MAPVKRVLVFGNSHVGAIKAGADLLSQSGHLMPIFEFAYVQNIHFDKVRLVESSLLLPEDPRVPNFYQSAWKRKASIDLRDYNYILISHGLSRLDPRLFYTRHNGISPFSQSLAKSIIHKGEVHSLFPSLGQLEFCKSIFLGAPPPSIAMPKLAYIKKLSNHEKISIKTNSNLIRFICEESLLSSTGLGFWLPPEHLLSDLGNQTLLRYIRGGVEYSGNPHSQSTDHVHANGEYGRELLTSLLDHQYMM